MFTVLNTVLLQPLPYSHPDRLVQIWETDSSRGELRGPISPANFLDWQAQSSSLAQMATYESNTVVLSGRQAPQRMSAVFASSAFFDVFDRTPLKGRTFLAADNAAENPRVAVLSYGAWTRHFAQGQAILGQAITLDGESFSIIGVMPADFAFPGPGTEAWCLRQYDLKKTGRGSHFLFAAGRLKPNVSLDQAQVEMKTIADRLSKEYSSNRSTSVRLVGLHEEIVGSVRQKLLMLWGAVVAVLLIACANVAGLLLARALSRQKEIAIRTALGGSRRRLAQQLLTESVLLSLIGGIVGLLFSLWAGPIIIASSNGSVPRLRVFHVDSAVVVFTSFACILTGLLFGCAPALHILRSDVHGSLKEGGWNSSPTSDRLHLRNAFVIAELAVAVVLVIGAALLTRTLWQLQHVDAGFQAQNILSFRISVPKNKYPDGPQRAELYQRIVDRLARIPGIESVGATNNLPFSGSRSGTSFDVEGHPGPPGVTLYGDYRIVSSNFLQTMRIRLVEGRLFSEQDNQNAPRVAIVNQTFVKKFFPGQNPLDQRIKAHDQDFNVVGVIADVKHDNLSAPASPEIYVCYLQADPSWWTFVVLRSQVEPGSLPSSVRNAVKEVTADEPIYDLRTMEDRVALTLGPQKFTSLLLGVFAALALALAAVGIYAVMAYTVAQRTREIGIRMALGANKQSVLRMILQKALTIAALGLSLGIVTALVVMRAVASMFSGLDAKASATFVEVAVGLLVLVLLASYLPARRASKVDPLVALRCE